MANRAADLLKVGRRLRGMTQDEVAGIYGISLSTYQRWENGRTNVPYDDVTSICVDVFKLTIEKISEAANAGG
ncbi:helix-turn-helix transcriptional regulator [Shewanella sp. DNRA4]|uniref:helix-turn-helix transcriptional regulator n=1 Tax=Shewanella TaxID=22 RepID=UPI00146C45DA|nr:helix-turn-helix transcriptional regulator [Shewanella sp. DNRA4]NMD52682.1 helix-turn-helix transcriptional regulator [Shewanella sp. DNRA4]